MNRNEVENVAAVAALLALGDGPDKPAQLAAWAWQMRQISNRERGRALHELNHGPLKRHSLAQREKDRARLGEIAGATGVPLRLRVGADPRGIGFVAVKCHGEHRGNSVEQDGWWVI